MGTMRDPKWWSEQHGGAWERTKEALRRDWEQTKADFHADDARDLDQNVGDTLKQAAGSEPIPPGDMKNPSGKKKAKDSAVQATWSDDIEYAHRYGVGAREQYSADYANWDDKLEAKLKEEWSDLKSGRTWEESRGAVRHAWGTRDPRVDGKAHERH